MKNAAMTLLMIAWSVGVCLPTRGAEPPVAASETTSEGRDIAWRLSGPGGGGWIQSIALDPRDKDVLLVGCDVGGFYFSSDAGRSYELRNNGLHDYFIESIAVHPKDSDIILLGTESGIHRTTDRGLHWNWLREGFPKLDQHRHSAPIGAICFDPRRPNVAYAGIGRPRWGAKKSSPADDAGFFYRSDDAGATWRRLDGAPLPARTIVSGIAVRPDDGRTLLAATTAGVFRSDDEGTHWQRSSDGLPHDHTEELAFALSSPKIVYVTLRSTAKQGEAWNGGVFRSDDAGRTWRNVQGEGLPKRTPQRAGNALNLSSNPKEIVIDPRDAETVYVGHRDWVTAGVYKTTDGGRHWIRVARRDRKESSFADYGWITAWGPSVECLAISPMAPDRLVFGTSGHVFLTDDAGKSWQQRYSRPATADGRIAGTGLEVTCVWRLVADPVRRGRVYYCYMDIGLLISDDEGRTFRRAAEGMKTPENCFSLVVDPQSPTTVWAATGWWGHNAGDVCRSDDDGKTWRVVGNPGTGLPDGQVLEMAMDLKSPAGRRRLVAISNGNGVFETLDGGASWHATNGNLPAEAVKAPVGLLLDPGDSNHLVFASHGHVFETRDAGKTWRQLTADKNWSQAARLVADPHRFGTLYIASRRGYDHASRQMLAGGVFRSEDGGGTWRQILDDRFASDVVVSPADSKVLYVATMDHPYHDESLAVGLLKSADGGRTWRRENGIMSHRNFKTLCISPLDPGLIYAGSSGNSAFVGRDAGVPSR